MSQYKYNQMKAPAVGARRALIRPREGMIAVSDRAADEKSGRLGFHTAWQAPFRRGTQMLHRRD